MKIAIDAMGGDLGPAPVVEAVLAVLAEDEDLSRVVMVGDGALIEPLLAASDKSESLVSRIELLHSATAIAMSEQPAQVLRQRRDSSMLAALTRLADGGVDACVSGGNSGALVGLSRHFVGLHAGIKQLAICAQLPTHSGAGYLLDVGANVDCSGEQLHQFARMGTALVNALGIAASCRCRALSIGVEDGKGSAAVKRAATLCEADSSLRFEGLIEGDRILCGDAEVIFCDGFAGNIALKSCEGAAQYIRSLAATAKQVEGSVVGDGDWLAAVDPARYNGAYLLGLNRIVVKSHGGSDRAACIAAINKAIAAVKGGFIEGLSAAMEV